MRRGKPHSAETYIRVRLDLLHDEKKKNDDRIAHLVLDKAIYELTIVLQMVTSKKD